MLPTASHFQITNRLLWPTELCRHLRGKILHVHSLFSAIVSPFCIPQTKTGTTCGFRSAAVGALSAFPPKRQAHSSG